MTVDNRAPNMTVCPAPCAVDDDYLGLIDDGHPACSGSAATDDELFRADCDSSPGALSARFGEVEKMLLGTYQIMFRYLLFSWFVIPGTELWNPSSGQLGEPNRRGSKSMPGFVFFYHRKQAFYYVKHLPPVRCMSSPGSDCPD